MGLSPRMRGNPARHARPQLRRGSIPAHAGKPPTPLTRPRNRRVYPRACGETLTTSAQRWADRGLSPRMRGNRPGRAGRACSTRSIPAHAGKPCRRQQHRYMSRVYPRACGETMAEILKSLKGRGLSPRMRGNPWHSYLSGTCHGSIPAHAGKPYCRICSPENPGVYPRACGETKS